MELIEPEVKLLSELGITPESHIARCARVCYGREYKEPNQEADKKMVEGLIKRGHLSMLRHASMYLGHIEDIPQLLAMRIANSSYWNFNEEYASTNLQEFMQSGVEKESVTVIDNKQILEDCAKHPGLFELYRLTFCITTQISTSRELNRVSPNAIAERSTRYCSANGGLTICRPWWIKSPVDDIAVNALSYYNLACEAEKTYMTLLLKGMKPEDARGVLPLDTATKVIYTYSVQEWKHILDLRYYGTTGKPHPNAKLITGEIREEINKFAIKHGIDYKV